MKGFEDLPGAYPGDLPTYKDEDTPSASSTFPKYLSGFIGGLFNVGSAPTSSDTIKPRNQYRGSVSPEKAGTSVHPSRSNKRTAILSPTKISPRAGAIITSSTPAVVHSAKRHASSSSDSSTEYNGDSAETSAGSVINIIRQHTGGLPTDLGNVDPSRKIKTPFPANSSGIVWKYRKNRRILDKPKGKKARTNAVQDLFDSDLMDTIEWEASKA